MSGMERLEQSGLYGADLLAVDSERLVARYNATLETLGLEATALPRFRVDGLGWSPEIAVEKGDRNYLSHGPANPLAIVVSPAQRGRPGYAPFATFAETLMETYFAAFDEEIADISRDACIGLDIDQQLSRYRDPFDLLLLRSLTVLSSSGGVGLAAARQADLVRRFLDEELAWFEPQLRRELLASARAHGDLRNRKLAVPELRFDEVGNFYSPAFGGVFVLRGLESRNEYLVPCDQEIHRGLGERAGGAFWLGNPELLEQLQAERLVDLDLEDYRQHPERLHELLEYLLVDTLAAADPDADLSALTAPQRKRLLRQLGDVVPERLFELERLIARLEAGASVDPDSLSPELARLLLRPYREVEGVQRRAVWQLLLRLEPLDVGRLHACDREHFFEAFRAWPAAKQAWAVKHLRDRQDRAGLRSAGSDR